MSAVPFPSQLLVRAAALLGLPAAALAVSITVGGVNIMDNAAMDTAAAANVITFNTAAAGGAGFAVPQGYAVSGTVRLGQGNALISGPNNRSITLTTFDIFRPAGAAGGAIRIEFSHNFGMALPAMSNAAFGIRGERRDVPLGVVGAGNTATFQGLLNGGVIAAAVTCNQAGVSPVPCNDGRVAMGFGPAGMTILLGRLDVMLPAQNGLNLPTSADVAASGETITVVPEPGSFGLLGLGLCALVVLRKRFRWVRWIGAGHCPLLRQ